jgi:CheY-like chemotaxis protein
MPRKILPKPSRLRLVVLNDSAPVLKMLCNWLQEHGHHCETALLADMPQAHDEVGPFIQKHRPDVVIYDVGMPYSSRRGRRPRRLLGAVRNRPAAGDRFDYPGVESAQARYYAFRHSIAVAVMRSLAQNNAQQRVVDLETTVVFDEPQLAELVHEEVDA